MYAVFTTRSSSCRTARKPATLKVGNRLRDVTRNAGVRMRCIVLARLTIARITDSSMRASARDGSEAVEGIFWVEESPATEYRQTSQPNPPGLNGPSGSQRASSFDPSSQKPSLPLKGMIQNESSGKSFDSASAPGRFAGNRRDQIHHHRHVHLSRDGHPNP